MTIEQHQEALMAERQEQVTKFLSGFPKLPPNVQRIDFTMKVTWDDGATLEADGNMEPCR